MENILNSNDINTIFNYYYDSNKKIKQHLYNDFINNQVIIVNKILGIESDNKILSYIKQVKWQDSIRRHS